MCIRDSLYLFTLALLNGTSQCWWIVEGVGPLGKIYDQDTANLAAQTRGFKSSFKRGETLGNYQEIRVRHLQKRVRDFLNN